MTSVRLTIEHLDLDHSTIRTYGCVYDSAEQFRPGEFGRVAENTISRILGRFDFEAEQLREQD